MIIRIAMLWGNRIGDRGQGAGDRGQVVRCVLLVLCFSCCVFATGQGRADDAVGLFQKGQFDEARVAFEAVLKEKPDDPVALYYLGRLSSESVVSRRYFQQLVDKHPQHDLADDAWFELIDVDFVQGLYVTARNKYRQLLQAYPETNKSGMVHYRIGMTFLAVRQADSALVAFDVVRNYSSDGLAVSHAKLGRLEALLQQGSEAEVVREAKAWLAVGAGDLDADVREMIRAISPKDVPAVVQAQPVGKFWIQVAAFKNQDGARKVKVALEQAGFGVELGHKKNSTWTFVFAGPYKSESSAKNDVKQIDKLVRVKSKVIER